MGLSCAMLSLNCVSMLKLPQSIKKIENSFELYGTIMKKF
jgi:hypothetical protein